MVRIKYLQVKVGREWILSIAGVAWGNEALWWLDSEQATLLTEKKSQLCHVLFLNLRVVTKLQNNQECPFYLYSVFFVCNTKSLFAATS